MIRILQLGMTNNLGGIETFLMNYYKSMDKNDIQFDFINIYDTPLCFQDEIKDMGGKIYNVPTYYRHPIKYINSVKKIINNSSYQIIHCNMNSAAMIFPLIAAKLSNAKIIIAHSHNASSDKGIIKSIMHSINKHFIPLLATNYFACSDKAGKWFYSNKILKSNKYKVIYNAIDIKKFQFNSKIRTIKRQELNINEDTLVIGHVGRFNKQKNHKFIIDVFKDVYDVNHNSILLLIGIGPLENEMKKKTKELGLIDNVKFLGQRNDVNELYNIMDIFVLPSLYEGLPLVGVEAQINGVKCLFANTITTELSISKECEYIKLDKNKWSEKILKYKNDKRIEKTTCKKFNINDNSIMLGNIYKEELEKFYG